jgi:uncharacterized protein
MKNNQTIVEINFTTKVFGWVAVGFFVSGIIAFKLWQNFYLLQSIIENYFVLGALVLTFLGFVIWISLNMEQWVSNKIILFFFGFAILNGIILPLIFQFFTQNFILNTFFILAGMFGGMSVTGYFFKQDLTSSRNLFFMTFLGIILNILLNFIWRKDNFQLITSAIAIIVFVGITAYNSKRIKEYTAHFEPQKAVIMSAFALYLDLYYLLLGIVFEANKKTKGIQH